ncbi:MAG: class II aldolase/adducin family protein [Magnetospiraceae bacterium]
MTPETLRQTIIETARRMNGLGINHGTSGNVSAREAKGFLITPSGMDYDDLTVEDIVPVTLAGDASGRRNPSSEWRFHKDIYVARAEIGAIVHTHSPYATTLACLQKEIPAFHYMVAAAGGKRIPLAAYATFGEQALSDSILAALGATYTACLIANHGLIACGATLEKALALAVEVETLSGMYWRALTLGDPVILADAEMDRVLEKFKTYGAQPKPR